MTPQEIIEAYVGYRQANPNATRQECIDQMADKFAKIAIELNIEIPELPE